MERDWKILDVFMITGRGPVILVDMPRECQPKKFPAKASIFVDGAVTQQVELGFGGFFVYRSVEAAIEGDKKSSFQISEVVERNVGRDWVLRIEE